MRGTQSKQLLLGCLIGVAVGVAVVPWIGIYGTLTDTDITEVARGISAIANTFVPGAVANTSVPGAPFVTEAVGLGIVIYMLAAIGFGIALAFGWRTLSPHQPTMDGFVFMIAALSTFAAAGAVVEGFIGIVRDTPAYTTALTH
jgi:hypothetical protein